MILRLFAQATKVIIKLQAKLDVIRQSRTRQGSDQRRARFFRPGQVSQLPRVERPSFVVAGVEVERFLTC